MNSLSIVKPCLIIASGVLLVASSAGCAGLPHELQRKFIRKKKPQPRPPIAATVAGYDYQLAPEERYRRHYSLWTFWHAELMEGLGASRKKALHAIEEGMSELQILQELLVPEHAQQLDPHLRDLRELQTQLQKHLVTQEKSYWWMRRLERQKRLVHEQFSWRAVQDFVVYGGTGHADTDAEAANPFVD